MPTNLRFYLMFSNALSHKSRGERPLFKDIFHNDNYAVRTSFMHPHVRYLPVVASGEGQQAPTRRIVLAWRRSFTRYEAIAALRNAIYACELPGVKRLTA